MTRHTDAGEPGGHASASALVSEAADATLAASSRPTAALETHVSKLLAAFDTVPVAAVEFDAAFKLVRYNAAGAAIFGGDQPGYELGTRNPLVREAAEEAVRRGRAIAHFSEFETAAGETKQLILTYLPDIDVSRDVPDGC